MEAAIAKITLSEIPVQPILDHPENAILAIVIGSEGPSYRPIGAAMAILGNGDQIGTLSSGCIESDIALHGKQALKTGQTIKLRYGHGSPFVDIQLPCGGGLDILVIPRPDALVLAQVAMQLDQRISCCLQVDIHTGKLAICEINAPVSRDGFQVTIEPQIRFLVFGKGPEALAFSGLVQSLSFPNMLISPDAENCAIAAATGSDIQQIKTANLPDNLQIDEWTAIVLFFHDHDWEPNILAKALLTPAFYIGAQGSLRASVTRKEMLLEMGLSDGQLTQLHGPVGLIPSARDARTLAVSVLAEILATKTKGMRS